MIAPSGSCLVVAQAITCSIPTLAAGASATITIPVTPSTVGLSTNTASATFTGGSSVQSAATVTVVDSSGAAIPAASAWGLMFLAAALGSVGLFVMRRGA